MKVLLSVYGLRIIQSKNEQVLSKFGGNVDLFKLFKGFYNEIHKNVKHKKGYSHQKLTLTCHKSRSKPFVYKERYAYGYFIAGRNGDNYKVKNYTSGATNKVKIIRPEDTTLRDAFFYLSVPANKKRGYLVLQVPPGKGIKMLVENFLNDYLKSKGLQAFRVQLTGMINEKVFHRMINKGVLKEMTFTKHGIPNSMDDLKNNDDKALLSSGTVKTIYQNDNLGDLFKKFALDLFKQKGKRQEGDQRTIIEFGHIKAEEVSVKVDVGGKKKTFQIQNFDQTLPDIDVTHEVLNQKKQIDIDKMVYQAEQLIDEVKLNVDKNDL